MTVAGLIRSSAASCRTDGSGAALPSVPVAIASRTRSAIWTYRGMGLRGSIPWNIAVTVYWYSRTVVKGLARAAPRGRFQYDSTRRAHEREKGVSRRLGAGDRDDGEGPARLPRRERNHEAPHHLSHGPGAGVDVCVRGCGRDASAPGRVQVSADEHAGDAEDVVGHRRRGRARVQEDGRHGPQGGRQ